MDSILSSGFVPESSPSQLVSATRTSTPTETLQSAPSFYQDVSIASTQFGSTQSPIVAYHHLSGSQAEPLPTVRQEHPFDSMPRHPYDSPAMSPRFPNNLPEDSTMDVTGKREWINSMLYYIGTELGIKKALAVPVMEGYMPIVKPRVDEIIGF